MRIITLNVNGIRAAARKGFFDWVLRQRPDVICLQETKARRERLVSEITQLGRYHSYFNDAEKEGYSGVALYCKSEPDAIRLQPDGPGLEVAEFHNEGRYIQADFGKLSIASLYMPSGSSSEARQAVKFRVMEHFMPVLRRLRRRRREYIICGDWNIAHKKIDIKNWRGNQKNSGFLPEERAWMDELFGPAGFVDAFRVVNEEPDQYTWWSNRGQAWAKNVGWRIDYQVITPGLRDRVRAARIYKDQRFSDHAPLILDYECELDAF